MAGISAQLSSSNESKVSTLNVSLTLHPLTWNPDLDRLAQSHNPYLEAKLRKRIEQSLKTGQSFKYSLPIAQLGDLARVYGEQLVADPWSDIERYFDVLTGRLYTRPIPTRNAILLLFGSGKPYLPNKGTLSVAGEALAGYCLEQFGYQPLVRPIGIMPDIIMTTKRSKELCLALCEAKGSVTTSPQKKILDEVGEFVLDIKSRATMFSRNHYEAFLICSFFKDGGDVESACLYIDLGAYRADKNAYEEALILDSALPTAQPSNDPQAQLQAILRAQANTVRSQDKYLAGMLSEEATRTAAIAMFRDKGAPPNSLAELDAYILERARQIGVEREWAEGQKIIGETKETEDQLLQAALRRYRHPEIEME